MIKPIDSKGGSWICENEGHGFLKIFWHANGNTFLEWYKIYHVQNMSETKCYIQYFQVIRHRLFKSHLPSNILIIKTETEESNILKPV